ncbi:ChaN family lipoprotein [uncultured Tateyamaria sp.]|uniref:ChaN family lipoprotein n=1 Tax=uncultured Tateyamaria sp. TaxID=455651 RepID=UPI002624A920|nr:ChaN family lipoprotein [uncultured Tateyamaria sp.]
MSRLFHSGILSAGALIASAFVVYASVLWSEIDGDVVIIGEFHDNPRHHHVQADALEQIAPKAVVFEMLTPDEATQLANVSRDPAAMEAASAGFHWTNIADYAGVLSRSTMIIGAALPRADMRGAFGEGAAAVFGPDAARYGLTEPVPEAQQTAREALQFEAHCAAMPLEMMGGMVEAQRLRDAAFARTVIVAVDTYGTPVVLITGNGHARTDWGVPTYLARVRPDLDVVAIGQGEAGAAPAGQFDIQINDAPRPDRADPCTALQTAD